MSPAPIRAATPDDLPGLMALYPAAFGDAEDLRPLVERISTDPALWLSLVAEKGGTLTGHVMFTRCRDAAGAAGPALLAPLAVHPAHQRQGVGRSLTESGRYHLAENGATMILVLGDTGYYGRLGFTAEREVLPPYPLPPEWDGAWQSMSLGATRSAPGPVEVPEPWHDRRLWQP